MANIPFGMKEEEWNYFCDSIKCNLGNYCNPITGLCSEHRKRRDEMLKQI